MSRSAGDERELSEGACQRHPSGRRHVVVKLAAPTGGSRRGRLALGYANDALVSFAELTLIAVPEPGSFPLLSLSAALAMRRRDARGLGTRATGPTSPGVAQERREHALAVAWHRVSKVAWHRVGRRYPALSRP